MVEQVHGVAQVDHARVVHIGRVLAERRGAAPSGKYAVAAPDGSIPAPVLRWQEQVHVPGVYDLEVDTSALTPEECAQAIVERLDAGSFTAFHRLADGAF